MRKYLILTLSLALILTAFGLGAYPAAQAQDDALIVATDIRALRSLDPAQDGSRTNISVFYNVYERLYELPVNPGDALIPNLATDHSVSEDGTVWTFNLRDDVTFASGNPLTADDVVFSWERVRNLQNEPAQVFNLFIGEIVAVDELTVQLTTATTVFPLPVPFIDLLTALPALSILDSQLVIENGGSLDPAEDSATEWLNQNSAGSGPYMVESWTPDTEVRLARNDNYWGDEGANLSAVVLRQVNDSTTALQLVERGEVDIAQEIDKDLAERVNDNDDLTLEVGRNLQIIYMALSPSENFEDSPLVNQMVRQAIFLAIDYDGITNSLLGGFAERPGGIVPLGVFGAEESLPLRYETDVEAARALMAEAGFEDGFTLTLNMPSGQLGGLSSEILAAKLIADLGEIGIDVEVNLQAPTIFRTERDATEYSAYVTSFSADFFDPTNWTVLFGLPDFQNVAAYIQLDNPELAEAALATIFAPADQRALAVAGFQQLLTAEAIYSVLYQPQSVDVVASNIEGYQFHPTALIQYDELTRN